MILRHFDGKVPSDFNLEEPADVKALTHILNVTGKGSGKGLWLSLPPQAEPEQPLAIGFNR
jgi:hypothetical protein